MKKFFCLVVAVLMVSQVAFACEHGQKTALKHQKTEKTHPVEKEKTTV